MDNNIQAHFSKSQLFKRLIKDKPIVLIDVGSSGGLNNKWRVFKGTTKVIGFEPDIEAYKRLKETSEPSHLYFPIALSDKKGLFTFNLTKKRACSSLLEPNHPFLNRFVKSENFLIENKIQINCDTLDNVSRDNGINDIDFVKIDTQGSELFVLKGMENLLSQQNVFGIEIELEFSPLYKNQPLFAEVDTYLREKGYSLFDIRHLFARKIRKTGPRPRRHSKGQVLATEAIYFKDFVSGQNSFSDNYGFASAVKSIALAELHGFTDFSLELLDFYHQKGIIESALHNEIKTLLLIKNRATPLLQLIKEIKFALAKFIRRS